MSNGEPSLWVFTTSSPTAQRNKGESLSNPVSTSILENHLSPERLEKLRADSEDEELYAWGSTPGPNTVDNWEEMEPGDYVLAYQKKGYIYWSQVISTLHSKELASEIWEPSNDGEVFEYMYFLQPPRDIDVAVEDVYDIIESKKYQGFSPVGGEHIERMRDQYGSIRDFLEERMGDPTYLLIRSNRSSEWDDEEGQSYHFGQTVPNHTQVQPGTKFLIDRKFSAGPNRIIAKGRFGARGQVGTDEEGRDQYRAEYDRYEPVLPPRSITDREKIILEQQEDYNVQHAIRRLSQDAFEELSEPSAAWIFQANPDEFDVRSSLEGREGKDHTWPVNQHAGEIDVGDRVYLWESGSGGGIVGTAYVRQPPREQPAMDFEEDFMDQKSLFEEDQTRAVLCVDRVLDSALSREEIKSTSGLEDLSVLQSAAATNFPVDPGEAETIERLLGTADFTMPDSPEEDPPGNKQDLPSEIESCLSLLAEKPQLIFSGPPGTSKTYGAFELISAIKGTYDPAGTPRRDVAPNRFKGDPDESPAGPVVWDIVQFHQSYGYEDFVSGIDARAEEEGLTFDRKDRIFLQLVEAAQKRDVPHVLIIDEINRGALGRVFGELILTLEYRDLPVRLPGQEKRIRVPENLFLIGTMNTADRNVSRIDHALRRRFNFVKRLPDRKRLEGYLSQEPVDEGIILSAFDGVRQAFTTEESSPGENVEYADDARGYTLEDYAVGHTYFMADSVQQLGRRLNRQVIPLLEEYKKEGILSEQRLKSAASGLQGAFGPQVPAEVDRWCRRHQ